MSEVFGLVDYVVFGVMLLVSAFVGIYFAFFASKKQNTRAEYLMGGKSMGIFPISMSLIASYISGISLLGLPAEMYVYGTQYYTVIIAEVLVSLTMAYVYIPVFYTLQITSSYEYLKIRFNSKVRTLGSCLFLLKMLLYIPMVIYVPALAFSQVTGINLHLITPIVCAVCIFYTTLGGLKAVVWTDTIQMGVMLLGIITVIIIGTNEIGIENVWDRNYETGRIEFNVIDPDPTVRHTLWGTMFGNYFYWLAACSVNQMMVQRCLAMPTRRKANFTILNLAIGISGLVTLCCFTGLLVYAYFYHNDPLVNKRISKSDQLLPYFVMAVGGKVPGLPGVFVSGVFSAALSTMSTGLNSMTGVLYEDLISPLMKKPLSEASASFVMKVLVVLIGAICVGLVFVVEKLGALIQAGKSLGGITAGPLLGLFSLGMFVPWANSFGALVGGVSGLAVTASLSILSQMAVAKGYIVYPTKPVYTSYPNGTLVSHFTPGFIDNRVPWVVRISYMWYALLGVFTVMTVGTIVSFMTGAHRPQDLDRDLFTPVIHSFLPKVKQINSRTNLCSKQDKTNVSTLTLEAKL